MVRWDRRPFSPRTCTKRCWVARLTANIQVGAGRYGGAVVAPVGKEDRSARRLRPVCQDDLDGEPKRGGRQHAVGPDQPADGRRRPRRLFASRPSFSSVKKPR
jgi:hypothetical protein